MRSIAIAILFLLSFSGISPSPQPKPLPPATLGVPPIAQHGHQWCWAACTEMCMQYYRNSIDPHAPVASQCELAKDWFIFLNRADTTKLKDTLLLNCSPDSVEGSQFDQPGQPYFFPNTPSVATNYYLARGQDTLSWDQLCDSFARKRPVIFTWGALQISTKDSGFSHFMVAEGCSKTWSEGDYRWVSVIDPWPLDDTDGHRIARVSEIAYSDYANTPLAAVIQNTRFAWCARGQDFVVCQKK